MMTSWARVGALCVCVDQEWTAPWADGCVDDVAGPEVDDVVTISHVSALPDGSVFIRIVGWSDYWELSAFRPLTKAEQDALYFSTFLTDSFVPARVMESACSR